MSAISLLTIKLNPTTMQMRDLMHFDEEIWSVWGEAGEGFFEPVDFGLHIKGGRSTACYCGYFSTYHLQDGFLKLLELQVNLDADAAPLLNGRVPVKNASNESSVCGDLTYKSVDLLVPFTGGLLLCRGLAKRPHGIGPELAWRFEQIRELIFESGKLIRTYNRSEAIAEVREECANGGTETTTYSNLTELQDDAYAQYKRIKARINSCFQCDY